MLKRKQRESDGSGSEEEDVGRPSSSTASFRNKEKVLVLCSRGATYRYRHLMMDMVQLLPHSKRESKLDTKNDREVINEVADMKVGGV